MGIITLFWILVTLNLIDFWLTSIILQNGGSELNPWVNMFMRQFGHMGILYAKAPSLILLGIIIFLGWEKLRHQTKQFAEKTLTWITLGFVVVNIYSFIGILY